MHVDLEAGQLLRLNIIVGANRWSSLNGTEDLSVAPQIVLRSPETSMFLVIPARKFC